MTPPIQHFRISKLGGVNGSACLQKGHDGLIISPSKRQVSGDENCLVASPSPSKQKRRENKLFSPTRSELADSFLKLDSCLCKKPAPNSQKKSSLKPRRIDQKFSENNENVAPRCPDRSLATVLHTGLPNTIFGRETEQRAIQEFISSAHATPQSLYISGPPGTGKSACISNVLNNTKKFQSVFLNCMEVKSSQAIYNQLLMNLGLPKCTTITQARRSLEAYIVSSDDRILLVLDEIDQLDSKNQQILYTIFEWPTLPSSRLSLIGIANALDFTDRVLPRLQARPQCKPQLLTFAPYTKQELVNILQGRMKEVSEDTSGVIDPMAVQFCAQKVASCAGDARRALDICRTALEICNTKAARNPPSSRILQSSSVMNSPACQVQEQLHSVSSSTATPQSDCKPKRVGIADMARIVGEMYGSQATSLGSKPSSISEGRTIGGGASQSDEETLPLQQKVCMATLLGVVKKQKLRDVSLGKLHNFYRKCCAAQKMALLPYSEFSAICTLLETRGLVQIRKAKENRESKIWLKLDEGELERVLQDQTLLASILKTL